MFEMKIWPVLLFVLALGGCDGIVIVNDAMQQPNYHRGDETYAARNGAIRVQVEGTTFGLAREQFASEVVNRMRAAYSRHEIFTVDASSATDPDYKIVMMFDPDPALSGESLCAASQPLPPVPRAPGESTSLRAAFCGGAKAISESGARVTGGVRGIDDARFSELIARTVNTLIPKDDYRQNSGKS
jgi:hypothetical protein